MNEFKEGDRVVLEANEEEGWPEEHGVFLDYEDDYPGMCMVSVDKKYRAGRGDDGLREIETKFVSKELP